MELFKSIVLSALLAGIVAGAALTGLQSLKVYPLIFAAEVFEDAGEAQNHQAGSSAAKEHGDDDAVWAPADGGERLLFSLLANVLTETANKIRYELI